jgi:simple sugar transport system permease protein
MELGSSKIKEGLKSAISSSAIPIISVLIALAIGAILILIAGINPIDAYTTLFMGAFGSIYDFSEVLARLTPILLIGLGYSLAYRCRAINLGGEGQFYIGALLGTVLALALGDKLPSVILVPLLLIAGFFGGAIWGAVAAFLKVKLDVHEVLSTILLNYIAYNFVGYLVLYPLKEPGGYVAWTSILSSSALIPRLIFGTRFHAGVLVALALIPIMYVLLWKTSFGYEIRAVGYGLRASRYAGIKTSRSIAYSLILSAGLAGLAGIVEVTAIQQRLYMGITRDAGWNAVPVAYLGKLHPFGVALASLLFAVLLVGGDAMQRVYRVPVWIVFAIQGIVLILVLVGEVFPRLRAWGRGLKWHGKYFLVKRS